MCGIIAFCGLAPPGASVELLGQLNEALALIKHRGPDGSNIWLNDEATLGLGHCRLAINDLSPAGQQPLHCEELHAVVNGEIYDYDRLRAECEDAGYKFSSNVDSELVLALYKIHGAPGLFEHLCGEFAFVLHDGKNGRTIVGRDRYGIKPLFWTKFQDKILFAAECKAFLAFGWQPEWDVASISTFSWMMADMTIFKGVNKVMPGHWMDISNDGSVSDHTYWDFEYPDKRKAETRHVDDIIHETRRRMVSAVRLRMKADVPMGMFLSGGIDSSTVAGIMTHLAREENVKLGSEATDRVSCYTIQFPDETNHDESAIADRTAAWLGIKHYKKVCDETVLAQEFQNAVYHTEHHLGDMNAVAKYCLASLPREQGIKVILTGEGADEHFGGYSFFLPEMLREPDLECPDSPLTRDSELRETLLKSAMSENFKVLAAQGSASANPDNDKIAVNITGGRFPTYLVFTQPADSVYADWVHGKRGTDWDYGDSLFASLPSEVFTKIKEKWHSVHGAFYLMARSVLHNLILAGMSDRAEMAHSLEGRPPLMDHHLTEYVNMLPPSFKIRYRDETDHEMNENDGFWWKNAGATTRAFTEKWLLREAARPFITDEQYKRRKQPFFAPTRWPKGGVMQKMFQGLLTEESVSALGFVKWTVVAEALEDAFGETGDAGAWRTLLSVGSFVVLKDRFKIKTAVPEDYTAFSL